MKVLLATDGNEPVIACERLLSRIAHRGRTDVRILAVNSFETVLTEAQTLGRYDPVAGHRQMTAVLDSALERLRNFGLRAEGIVEDGHAATEILAVAARERAGLIALGAGHTRWLDTLLLGSTSTEVVHGADCSVLIVHEAAESGAVEVLVATDGSTGSGAAIQALVELADPSRCRVRVVAVVSPPPSFAADAAGGENLVESARKAAVVAVESASDTLTASGFAVRTEIATGAAAAALLERAGRHDLVVVGCRGLGAVRRKLLGSVSDRVVRHARATLVGR